ncbi:DUF5682 family protein [Asaia lannensis]|uniref:DUF5682 family protein n=1 Tax=Asaia lannensis NBRC 102526 TaxID=1307926 RepID=A0ABT1CCZ1_9PROT|nr:DUF5682 family protein [Asaia lannensis]MCO6158431.1 DUF5682 family protein [Asaia lannensis NBRC 102526]GBR01264.1 hypothetical protein AA102526_2458 [Asaia lannensis NBRC 102526]
MDPRLHFFGIRHHGPGSAASLIAALDDLAPALVLIEGQPEADRLVPYAALEGMTPPLALLHYQTDNPANAVFSPFADYSPEWQALLWAARHNRNVRFIDWPAACLLAWEDTSVPPGRETPAAGNFADNDQDQKTYTDDHQAELQAITKLDPLDDLAQLAGYADGEAWWHAMVEHAAPGPAVFAAIDTAMTALRDSAETGSLLTPQRYRRDLLREAFMRIALRQALKDEEGQIAVVTGAWHVPALKRKTGYSADRALIRDLKKVRTDSAWVPWSDARLASGSGYSAGVTAPGWYRHLWHLKERAVQLPLTAESFTAGWLAKVSGLLRSEGLVTSSASTLEAARLALALAAIRGKSLPDLAEMQDAAHAVLCHGETAPLSLIQSRLLIGEQIGALDPAVPQIPLARDLERWQKKCRLKPETEPRDITLDLRTEAGLLRSTLLHRLTVLDLPWGRLVDGAAGRGTYREIWRMSWSPSYAIALVQALPYGVTIEQAANNKAIADAGRSADIAVLSGLVRQCLLADLPDATDQVITRLHDVAVTTQSMASLMESVVTLVSLLRYGGARPLPEAALRTLVWTLCVEICAGFSFSCRGIDKKAACSTKEVMAGFDQSVTLFGEAHLTGLWDHALRSAIAHDTVSPTIRGTALRLLHDRQAEPVTFVLAGFSRSLLPPVPAADAGDFIESFLSGGAEILVQDHALLAALDDWIMTLDETQFIEILPMMRRSFSDFALTTRKRLLDTLLQPTPTKAVYAGDTTGPLSAIFSNEALPLLCRILGLAS